MPSPTDGSHQLPIPTDELVVGEVLPPRMPCGPAVAFQGPRHLCVQRSGCGPPGADPVNPPPGMRGDISGPSGGAQGPWHLRLPLQAPSGLRVTGWAPGGCRGGRIRGPLSCCLLALRHGGKRVRALGTCAIHPSEGDGGLGVLCCVGLHGHPRAREGEMPETSGASQVHLRLSMEVLLRQLRNLERSRPPAAPHCDSICVQ